jgi:sarcosine oxidase
LSAAGIFYGQNMAIDVVIVGLGVMGSAAAFTLARRGQRVVGIERFEIGHDRGSSHGATRIIRLGYFEHPSYVPLLRRAYELWRGLDAETGESLLHLTGIVEIGAPEGVVVSGTLSAARTHDLPHEILDADAAMRKFPAFRLPPDYLAVTQPDGGFLLAEPAIQAFAALATEAGAELRTGETVRAIEPGVDSVKVITERHTIEAGAAIVTAGPWLKTLLPSLGVPLRATRQVLGWFEPLDPRLFASGTFPVFLLESRHGIHYGFPPSSFPAHLGSTVKIARHYHADQTVDPDSYDRTLSSDDEGLIRSALAEHLPAANGRLVAAKTCLYTMTPDSDFIIDHLPGAPHIVIASPCSGHGFKFAPVIGEILADLAATGATAHDIARFRLSRFA